MMEKIEAGEITGQAGGCMLRATAANGRDPPVDGNSPRSGGESQTGAPMPARWRPAALGRLMTAGVMMGSMMKADRDL